MLGALFSKPKLAIKLAEASVFLYPASFADNRLPTHGRDPLVSGTVCLSLPSARSVEGISVSLRAVTSASAGPGHPYSSNTITHTTLQLPLAETLTTGNHSFQFTIVVPSCLGPSQRCTFGRTRYYIKAVTHFNSSVVTSSCSVTIPVSLVAVSSDSDTGAPSISLGIQHISEDLGLVDIAFTSPHLRVGGLLEARLALPAVNNAVTIQSIDVIITQHAHVSYAAEHIVRPAPQRTVLTKILPPSHDSAPDRSTIVSSPYTPFPSSSSSSMRDVPVLENLPIAGLASAQPYTYSRTLRVPTDNIILPTTLVGTNSIIGASHTLGIEMTYLVEGNDEEQILSIAKDVVIASCCTVDDSLPAYSTAAPILMDQHHNKCSCYLSVFEMMPEYGRPSVPTSNLAVGLAEIDREAKSPVAHSVRLNTN